MTALTDYFDFVMTHAPYFYWLTDTEEHDPTWGRGAFVAAFAIDFLYQCYNDPRFEAEKTNIRNKIVELADFMLTQQCLDDLKEAYGGFKSTETSTSYYAIDSCRVILGLVHAFELTEDSKYLDAAMLAADFLYDMQHRPSELGVHDKYYGGFARAVDITDSWLRQMDIEHLYGLMGLKKLAEYADQILYNFVGVMKGTGPHTAYSHGSLSEVPPTGSGWGELSDSHYPWIWYSDDTRYYISGKIPIGEILQMRFRFRIEAAVEDITKIVLLFEGYSNVPPCGITIKVWNYSTNSYTDAVVGEEVAEDRTLELTLTENLENYVDADGYIHLFARNTHGLPGDAYYSLYCDYISCTVFGTGVAKKKYEDMMSDAIAFYREGFEDYYLWYDPPPSGDAKWHRVGLNEEHIYDDCFAYALLGLFDYEGRSLTVEKVYEFLNTLRAGVQYTAYNSSICWPGYMDVLKREAACEYYDGVTSGILYELRETFDKPSLAFSHQIIELLSDNFLYWGVKFKDFSPMTNQQSTVTVSWLGHLLLNYAATLTSFTKILNQYGENIELLMIIEAGESTSYYDPVSIKGVVRNTRVDEIIIEPGYIITDFLTIYTFVPIRHHDKIRRYGVDYEVSTVELFRFEREPLYFQSLCRRLLG